AADRNRLRAAAAGVAVAVGQTPGRSPKPSSPASRESRRLSFSFHFSLSFERPGKNDFISFAFSLSCGTDLNNPSVGELKSAAVGDSQLSIVVSLTDDWAINCESGCAGGFRTRDLGDR